MNIGIKLIIAFLIISSLIVIVSYFSYATTNNVLEESVGIRSMEISNQMMNRIESNLFHNVKEFQIFVRQDEIQKELSESNEAYAKLENPQQLIDKLDNEWISKPKNVQTAFMLDLINNQLSEKFRDHQSYYQKQYGYVFLGELFITNTFGANVAQSGKTSDFKQNDEKWWQQAKDNGIYISEIKYDDSAEIFARDIALRINDSEDNFLGVIKYVVNVQEIFVILDEVNLAKKFETQQITLLDNDHNIIYTTKVFDNNTNFLSSFPNVNLLEQLVGKEGYFMQFSDMQENKKLVSFVTSSDNLQKHGMNWTLIIEYDTSEILKPVSDLKFILMFISGITALGAIIFGLFVSRSISKPIFLLKNAIKKMEKGNFSEFTLSKSDDEIGELGNSFHKMSKEIKKIIQLEKELVIIEKEKTKNEKLIAVGELSARLAHDLRNPLSVLRTSLENIQFVYGEKSDLKRSFTRMNAAIDRMSHQLDGVMDFVRQKPITLINNSLFGVLEGVVTTINIPKSVKITYPKDDLTISCDLIQMQTVFSNIILNGVQAINEDGQIEITASYHNDDSLVIIFTDSGPPIPEKILSKVFEPLFTTKQKGTGLGLSSCKTIIENHGGSIRVTNNPTSFKIILPKPTKNDMMKK